MICKSCLVDKPLDGFYLHSHNKPRKHCKICFVSKQKPKTPEQTRQISAKRWSRYKTRLSLEHKEWRERNLDKCAEKSRTYYARKYNQMPLWADRNKIKEIYLNCPEGYHVDHIIPLKGKVVSGLHVPENLQYLPAKENMMKRNKYETD